MKLPVMISVGFVQVSSPLNLGKSRFSVQMHGDKLNNKENVN